MMLALGCIQALECNRNTCPTGVATQDPELVAGLVVSDKKVRVARFQQSTVHGFVELLGAAGLERPEQIRRSMINRRISMQRVMRYDELFPYMKQGVLLKEQTIPSDWKIYMDEANPNSFDKTFEDLQI
jgi:hypothetical protein